MNQKSDATYSTFIAPGKEQITMEKNHSSSGELVVKGVATAVVAATIIQTGKGVLTTLAKQPLVMFGLGVVTGCFAHKYRKEIISITRKTAEQSKDFVLQQKENIKDLIAESQEGAEETDVLN